MNQVVKLACDVEAVVLRTAIAVIVVSGAIGALNWAFKQITKKKT